MDHRPRPRLSPRRRQGRLRGQAGQPDRRPLLPHWGAPACLCFFFFQAEDGIRDIGVTGVQTCALPISGKWSHNTGLEGTNGAWRDLVDSGELPRNIARRLEAVGYSCHLTGKFTNDLTSGEWVCPGFDSWWAQLEPVNDKDHLYFSKGGTGRREMPRTGTEEEIGRASCRERV